MINRPHQAQPRQRHRLLCRFTALAVFCSTMAAIVLIGSGTVVATEQLSAGSSSKQLRNQTVNSIPYQQLNQQTKEKISEILKKPSIYRRLPVTAINADPDYFQFLVRYPEVIVNIWQLMGVTNMETERTGPYTFTSDDGAGTVSSLELVYGTENLHIFYGTGFYEGPVLKRKLNGKAVLVLRSEHKPGPDGKPVATSQLDVFLKVENATIGLVAKTIQPLVGPTADHNFVETMKFVQRLNRTTEKNGPGVQRMAEKLNIDAEVRKGFNRVVDTVFQRAINAAAPEPGYQPASVESKYLNPQPPARSLNGQNYPGRDYPKQTYQLPNQQAPAYHSVHGVGQNFQGHGQQSYRSVDARWNQQNLTGQYRRPQPQRQLPTGYGLPARGYQAPGYASPANDGYYQGYDQAIQATYQNNGAYSPNQVQPAVGWMPQR